MTLAAATVALDAGQTHWVVPRPALGQDACRFGAITPEDYLELASEVTSTTDIPWGAIIPQGSDAIEHVLHDRLRTAVVGRERSEEQVAAMHALMRGMGAEFSQAFRVRERSLPGLEPGDETVLYRYRLDVNKIGVPRLLFRWAVIIPHLGVDPASNGADEPRRVTVLWPSLDPGRPGWKKPTQTRPCPPLPHELPPPR